MAKVTLRNILDSDANTGKARLEELKELGFAADMIVHAEEKHIFKNVQVAHRFQDGSIEAVDANEQFAVLYLKNDGVSFKYWLD